MTDHSILQPLRRRHTPFLWLAGVLLGVLVGGGTDLAWSAPASQYTLLSLGENMGLAIDKVDDTVVGSHTDAEGHERAAILFPVFRDLGQLQGGLFAVANAVAGGRICGASGTGPFSFYEHAFLWDGVAGLQDLGTAGDVSLASVCAAVNPTQAVGYGDDPTVAHIVPLVWDNGVAARILPTGTQSGGYGTVTNDAGDVCGQRRTDPPAPPAFLATCWWKEAPETPVNIDTLDGSFSLPLALNNDRQVCGIVTQGQQRAFIYDPAGGMRLLANLPDDTQASCNDLNDLGDAVGTSRLPDPNRPAFVHEVATIWGSDAQPIDLNTRVRNLGGRVIEEALGVSNRGTIIARVGRGEDQELVLLIPDTTVAVVPPEEPRPPRRHKRPEKRQREPKHWASGNPRLSAIADLIEAAQQEHEDHDHGQGRHGR